MVVGGLLEGKIIMPKRVAFYSPHICLRGTTVALTDYAHFNQVYLNNESIIINDKDDSRNSVSAIDKVRQLDINLIGIQSVRDLDRVLQDNKCDAVYIIKVGRRDERWASVCKTLIHCVGMEYDPHGDVYSYVSEWLSKECSGGKCPTVPYMVHLPETDENMRNILGIPHDALVFGRNGGIDTWDISFVDQTIEKILQQRKDVYFLFQNTPLSFRHERVIHINSTADLLYKRQFINTCDAMIHARHVGESFGLSCAEFSICNKPIITWGGSRERNHLHILKDKALVYNTADNLYHILLNLKSNSDIDWNCYREFSPIKVMEIFNKVYLQ